MAYRLWFCPYFVRWRALKSPNLNPCQLKLMLGGHQFHVSWSWHFLICGILQSPLKGIWKIIHSFQMLGSKSDPTINCVVLRAKIGDTADSGDLRYYKSLDTSCNKWLEMIKVGLCHAACRVLQGAAELQSAVSFSAAFHRLDPSSDIANTRPRATTCSGEREEREGNVLSQEELVPDPECFHFYMITASCYIITRAFPPPTPLSLSVVSVVCS